MMLLAPVQQVAVLSGGPLDGRYVLVEEGMEEIPGALDKRGDWVRATYCRTGTFTNKGRPVFEWVKD